MADNAKPNHFHNDSLGDPLICTGDHNHPERTAEEQEFVERLKQADQAREKLVEEVVGQFVELAVNTVRLDPRQDGRVPADYQPDLPCRMLRADLYDVYVHVIEEIYSAAEREPWFRR